MFAPVKNNPWLMNFTTPWKLSRPFLGRAEGMVNFFLTAQVIKNLVTFSAAPFFCFAVRYFESSLPIIFFTTPWQLIKEESPHALVKKVAITILSILCVIGPAYIGAPIVGFYYLPLYCTLSRISGALEDYSGNKLYTRRVRNKSIEALAVKVSRKFLSENPLSCLRDYTQQLLAIKGKSDRLPPVQLWAEFSGEPDAGHSGINRAFIEVLFRNLFKNKDGSEKLIASFTEEDFKDTGFTRKSFYDAIVLVMVQAEKSRHLPNAETSNNFVIGGFFTREFFEGVLLVKSFSYKNRDFAIAVRNFIINTADEGEEKQFDLSIIESYLHNPSVSPMQLLTQEILDELRGDGSYEQHNEIIKRLVKIAVCNEENRAIIKEFIDEKKYYIGGQDLSLLWMGDRDYYHLIVIEVLSSCIREIGEGLLMVESDGSLITVEKLKVRAAVFEKNREMIEEFIEEEGCCSSDQELSILWKSNKKEYYKMFKNGIDNYIYKRFGDFIVGLSIGSGMKKHYSIGQWNEIKRKGALALDVAVQGSIGREELLSRLEFDDEGMAELPKDAPAKQKFEWFKEFIEEASDVEVENLITLLSGSRSIASKTIRFKASGGVSLFPAIFTCTATIAVHNSFIINDDPKKSDYPKEQYIDKWRVLIGSAS